MKSVMGIFSYAPAVLPSYTIFNRFVLLLSFYRFVTFCVHVIQKDKKFRAPSNVSFHHKFFRSFANILLGEVIVVLLSSFEKILH